MTTSPGLEGLTASAFILERLKASTALQGLAGGTADDVEARVHEGVAPEDVADAWWITFTVIEPRDVKVVGLHQVMAMVQVQVKVTVPGPSYVPAMPVYQAIHQALEATANVQTALGLVLTCGRVSGIQYPERANGVEYRHLGGLYETHTQ